MDLQYSSASEPYCIYNRTEYSYINVTKTREVKVAQPWYKKLSKPKTKIEEYVEQEAVAKIVPVRGCCEGYEMSELQMCEPRCLKTCPQNSKCVEPEVCKCSPGYFSSFSERDGRHYCEPICEKPCPAHSECVKPNECACHNGYHLFEGTECRPYCASGCPFQGKCIAPNQCECSEGYKAEQGTCSAICSQGYVWNVNTKECEPNPNGAEEEQEYQPLKNDPQQDTNSSTERQPEIETDIDTWREDVDPNQVFDEIIETTTSTTDNLDGGSPSSDSGDGDHTKCPDDYVRYRGQCQPLKFAIDEIDCRLKPCTDPHAICSENGTCSCQEGYRMLKRAFNQADTTESTKPVIKSVCLTPEAYEKFMANPTENFNDHEIVNVIEESSHITAICLSVVGVLALVAALIYVGLRFVRRQHDEMDVEGKQLECTYDSRVGTDAEKSVI
ncbi:protein draper [Musca vetustissima]|uniref:protein draper n=1 Tax=Musca vetustissima TaxID=27455 RepID=UPI002AB7A834|nr:protein draper [Musca vetustissima]